MKKTLLIMVMALAVLLTQCRKPEVKFPSPVAPEGTTVSMTVTAGPGSKTDITTAGGITWSSGDKLYVGDGSKYVGCLTIVSGEGTPTGTFSGDVTLTGISEGTEKEFGFFYLGNAKDYSAELEKGTSTEVAVSFATQEIYDNSGNLENASKYHVGYGSAKGTVKDGVVTGINVTLVSKVALARFSFTEAAGKGAYTGPLTLSGTGIYNSMTVGFGGSFSHGATADSISLTGSHAERYVMLVPVGSGSETLNFVVGDMAGGTKLENGIEANKFYGRESAIAVTLHEYVDLGLPSGLLWATCNLGATNGETAESWYGDYYAWGETAPYYKDGAWCTHPSHNESIAFDADAGYKWKNYLDGEHTSWDISYEWSPAPYGSDTTLTSDYDAATANWGGDWRMPTEADFTELINNTTQTWYNKGNTEFNGAAGVKFANNSDDTKYIFLSGGGYINGTKLTNAASMGYYMASELSPGKPNICRWFYCFYGDYHMNASARYFGRVVRPVR